jgi:hypothetical protein
MIEITWNDGESKRAAVYNADIVDKRSIIEKYLDFDFVEFWYPQVLNEDIRDLWGINLWYIHYRQKWDDSSYTNIINLEDDKMLIYNRFNKEARYEIRRSLQRDNIHFSCNQDPSEEEISIFITYYNRFADSKGLQHISEKKLMGIVRKKAVIITCAYSEENSILCMHSYICEVDSGRVVLYTSASDYHDMVDNKERQFIGRVNRALHYNDMVFFKSAGMKIYDWGGTYLGEDNVELKNITLFKQSFGGVTETSRASIILPLSLLRNAKVSLERFLSSGKLEANKNIIIFGFGIVGKYVYDVFKKNNIIIYKVIDNNIMDSGNREIHIYEQDILASVIAMDTILLCTTSKTTYEGLLSTFETYGFSDGINCFGIRE